MITLSTLAPGSAVAASPTIPSQDYTHPLVMQQAATEVGAANIGRLAPFTPAVQSPAVGGSGAGLNREVFGFGLASSLGDATLGYPSWNFSVLTTVAFFGLHVNDGGTFVADSGWNVWNSSQLTGLLNTAHAAGTKVVVTIILQDFCVNRPDLNCPSGNPTPHMCAGLSNRAATVAQTVAEVKAKGVDGVNIDYEGLQVACQNGVNPRTAMTDLTRLLRGALPGGSYLSVDTYASSAADPVGFFDVPGLNPYADSFFVMAYDSEYSNYGYPPTSCTSFCLGPTAPLNAYHYNDTVDMTQYVAAVPASKVILGVPYYGRKSCVAAATPNQYPLAGASVTADGYLDANAESTASATQPGSFATHRDANDPAGQERWDTWVNTTLNCTRELYWDDTSSLGLKYDLVNTDNLRGVGLWNLNFGGGAPELWNLLRAKFTTTTTWYALGGVSPASPAAASFSPDRADVFVLGTDNGIWHGWRYGAAWSGWESLGGSLTSGPGAVSWGPNRIDLFARGTDNGLMHKFWYGTAWSNWESLGGTLTSAPVAASWTAGRLDIFARGTHNQLIHKWWDGSQWAPWEDLGGVLAADPAAVSWSAGRIDVFVRGTDNALWHKFYYGAWSGWESDGGVLSSGPGASSCAAGRLDIFAAGADSALYQLTYNGSWTGWGRLGGGWSANPGAVCPPGSSSIDVFERDFSNSMWRTLIPTH
ncbi:MAG TPA: glycosyl hydrolase family 18 protein [Candidatus Dormibacteraeota bacterium]